MQDYQLDWEAILCQNPVEFVREVSRWLYPAAARGPATNTGARPVNGLSSPEAARPGTENDRDPSATATAHSVEQASELEQHEAASSHADDARDPVAAGKPPGHAAKQQHSGSGVQLGAGDGDMEHAFDKLPVVAELIPTLRNRIEALNGPSLQRI